MWHIDSTTELLAVLFVYRAIEVGTMTILGPVVSTILIWLWMKYIDRANRVRMIELWGILAIISLIEAFAAFFGARLSVGMIAWDIAAIVACVVAAWWLHSEQPMPWWKAIVYSIFSFFVVRWGIMYVLEKVLISHLS